MLDAPFGRNPILWLLCGVLSSASALAQDGTDTSNHGAPREIPYEIVDGLAIHAGDIILGTAEEVAGWGAEWSPQTGGPPPVSRAAPPGRRQNGASCLWPGGVIPYVIEDDVPGRDRILRAIREWDTKTVLRFVERTSQHQDYLHYTLGSVSGTWLCAGESPGNVVIQIEPGGSNYEVILHGIGHAIGLAHEQQRRDRDRWVTVFSENIAATPYAQGNWHPHVGLGADIGPYDYRSIMTYSAFDHNKRRNHARTLLMETIPPGIPFGGEAMGELSQLSPGDIDSVARLYGHVPTEHVIATNPPGLDVIVDGERVTAPVSFTWEIDSKHTLEMPSPQFRLGSRFLFGRWSDDGDRVHTITATRDTTLYYANFIAQHQVSTGVNVSCRRAACSPDDGSVTITPASPDGYYTLRTPIEIAASAAPGSAVRFLRWEVSGDHWWSWWWTRMHGGGSNPARTRVGPGLAYRAQFVDGPIFRVDSNVDPVQVFVGDWWGETPAMFRAEEFSGTTTVSPRLIERRGKGYRHRFRSWSDGGEMTHAVEVPQDADSTLTLSLDTEYRLNTRAWQEWFGNRIETVPASADGFYAEGTVVRLRASAKAPAEFLGWNGGVSGRDPSAVVVMDDGQLAEAAFNLDAIELQSGVPAHVSLRWQGTDLEYHELDSERYYLQVPPDASELQIQFDSLSATPRTVAGLWVAAQDLWPGWVKGSETANLILGDGVARVTIPRPPDRWPAVYTILVRAAESNSSQAQALEGALVATVGRYANPNRAPQAVGTLEDRTLSSGGAALVLDVARAFADPDGDLLTYTAISSSAGVAAVALAGSMLTVTPVGFGSATVTVTATDPGGASATQQFEVAVAARATFTDHPITPGATPIKAIHFVELRERIDTLRARSLLPAFRWTDPTLVAGVTPVKLAHLTELRSALDAVYDAVGRSRPTYTDATTAAGALSIKAAHVMELRTAVSAVK